MEVVLKIETDNDFAGYIDDQRGITGFITLSYKEGGLSRIPEDFMINNWRNHCATPGTLYIGKCSGFGLGSFIRFSNEDEKVSIGRYVSGGIETMFMTSGYHEIRGISTCEFGSYDKEIKGLNQVKHNQIAIRNDVWFGDGCMILADSVVENGCVIGARSLLPLHFRSEPFGIYAGSPATLKKFRFTEKVRELLLDIAWWDAPLTWIKENNDYFLRDMTADNAPDILLELKEKKELWIKGQNISAH